MTQKKRIQGLVYGMMVILLILIMPGATFAGEGDEGSTSVQVGGYSIHLIFLQPATIGENLFHVQVMDEMGMAVNGAEVYVSNAPVDAISEVHETLNAGTPETSGMDEMNSDTPAPEHTGHTSGTGETDHTASAETSSAPGEQHESHDAEQVEPAKILLEAGEEAGEYTGAITFLQAGHSRLIVHLIINGASLEAQFPVEVARSSSVYAILVGFLALNFTVIGSAAILKRKNAPASSI